MHAWDVVSLLGVVAGGIVSISVIWNKGLKPVYRTLRKMDQMYERIEALPDWCNSVDEKLRDTHQMLVEHIQDHNHVAIR